jgi:NADH-quinone oxidoreductase subunit C
MMNIEAIYSRIQSELSADCILSTHFEATQPYLVVAPEYLVRLAFFLRDTEGLYFDYLNSLAGVDYGTKENKLAVVYHLYSLTKGHSLVLKCHLPRTVEAATSNGYPLPHLPSVSKVWRAADWHERETYDLLGIMFTEREDLNRMFLPDDWEGYPLRKDYTEPEFYHDIKVGYY